jgi:glycosyltransferase involved in cell wall biosynthesis
VTGTFDTDAYAKRPKWQKLMIKSGFRWGDLNIFVGKEMMAEAQRIGTLKRASYSPHIISDQYAVNTSVSRNPHIVFNIAHKMISNMNRKMIPELVEAFAIVLKSIPDAHLILAGEPSTGQIILETRVKELGIENAVTFLGIISFEDKINYLQSCGVYCQVSRYEGFGLAIAEAMACGAPVLVSNCGSVPEVVGDAGMYVPDLSVESIASSLLTLMTDRQLADSYGAKASDRINTCFRQTVRYEHFRSELSKLD